MPLSSLEKDLNIPNEDTLRMIKINATETPKTLTPTIFLKQEPLIKNKLKNKIEQ